MILQLTINHKIKFNVKFSCHMVCNISNQRELITKLSVHFAVAITICSYTAISSIHGYVKLKSSLALIKLILTKHAYYMVSVSLSSYYWSSSLPISQKSNYYFEMIIYNAKTNIVRLIPLSYG